MMLDTDFHSHVSRSSATQMARSAHERGIRVLGVSEHVFQMNEGRTPLAHPQTLAILREACIAKVRIWRQRVAEEYTVF